MSSLCLCWKGLQGDLYPLSPFQHEGILLQILEKVIENDFVEIFKTSNMD